MIVTAWNNGQHLTSGAGYGLKISISDRDKYFRREWQTIFLLLENQANPIEVNVAKPSFWSPVCRELIHAEIGRWMLQNSLAPWPKGKPPKLVLEPTGLLRHFRLRKDT
jgi:hypothetical protein